MLLRKGEDDMLAMTFWLFSCPGWFPCFPFPTLPSQHLELNWRINGGRQTGRQGRAWSLRGDWELRYLYLQGNILTSYDEERRE
jgi:hypothetical protein